jgi:PAS domain S-box-containing protein
MHFNELSLRAKKFLFEPSLRSSLIILAVAILLPMIAVAAFTSMFLAERERARFEQGASDQVTALRSAFDTELKSSISTLTAMANSRSLDGDDLRSFYAEAARVVQTRPDWITVILLAPSGQQVVNLLRPLGAELPVAFERATFEEVLDTGKPVVGALVDLKLLKGMGFTVRVPVIRDGLTKYVLSAGVNPKAMLELLVSQKLPANWVAGVVDRNGRIVARTREPERYVGQFATKSLLEALARVPQGWFQGTTLDGAKVYTAYHRSAFSGWTVAIGIPAAQVEAGARQTILMIGGGTLVAGLLAVGFAIVFGRRITVPVFALASAAKAMGRGEQPEISSGGGIAEISLLSRALKGAAEAMHEREQRFRLLADATPVLIWISGREKLCTWFNKFWLDFVGRTLEQEIGNGWTENVHPDDLERLTKIYSTAFDRREPFAIEYRLLCAADRKHHWVFDKGVPHYKPDGEFAGFIGSAVDITDRKEADEALRNADRRKDEFLALLGHELRNPLGIITMSVQLLARKAPADHALVELREMIERQTEHMSQMMDDLLDVSRITRGQIRLKKERCNLAEIVRHVVGDHHRAIDESGLNLILDVSDRPMWIKADPMRLAQTVGNLLNNARKFSDRGGTLTVRLVESPQGSALLSVHDTGIGIETEMLKYIFEPFTQSDHSIDRSHGGLGMGLALVKALVELHDGEVRAESPGLGRGAEFTVRLPLIQDYTSPQPISSRSKKMNARSRHILIIEDNALAARSMQLFLELVGHRVKVARTGSKGIEAAEQSQPEVVLCDIGLPELDGYAVARHLRKRAGLKDTYLVAISGYGQEADQQRARDAGFDLHMTKPINPDQLDAIIAGLDVKTQ